MKQMKKVVALVVLSALVALALAGCKTKTVCDWCGEEKYCNEESFFGEKVYLCDDCMD